MFGKALFFFLLLAGVAVVPYLINDHTWLARVEEMIGKGPSKSDPQGSAESPEQPSSQTLMVGGIVADPSARYGTSWTGNPVTSFRSPESAYAVPNSSIGVDMPLPQLLSFEATPEWITQNWDRVTNRVGELDLQGWDVPYFRSGRQDDFAGSVTYYFDRARRVQRIVLHGYTSDATEFVQLAKSHYQMRRTLSIDGDLYLATIEDKTIGGLHLRYAALLNAKTKIKRCELLMELNRKRTEYGMSYEFERLIRENREANVLLTPIQPSAFLNVQE